MCAWDKTQPQGSTKIRNLGDVITPNWKAIEDAEDTFKPLGLNLNKNAVDRTAITDTMTLYNKNNELYAIDPSSVVTQLTGLSGTAAASGSTTLLGGIIIKWGAAAIVSAAGGTTVNFVSAFPNNCWQVVATPWDNNANYVTVISKLVGSFKARSNNAITIGYIAIGN